VLVVSPGFVATDIRQRALGPTGNRGQSPRDESKGMTEECASNRLGDGTTQTRAHHDVERQSDTLGKADSAGTG